MFPPFGKFLSQSFNGITVSVKLDGLLLGEGLQVGGNGATRLQINLKIRHYHNFSAISYNYYNSRVPCDQKQSSCD
jgi:hypothetical protein